METVTFVTLARPGPAAAVARRLARSIRDFGGSLARAPILAMVPSDEGRMSRGEAAAFEGLGVRLAPFDTDPAIRPVPFAAKAAAAAAAEGLVSSESLVWLDPDVLVIADASAFLIPGEAALGYRPVHHRLIGPGWDEPLGDYWHTVFSLCGVPETLAFRMTTRVGEPIRAYFNAGVFAVRPDRGVLARWPATIATLARDPRIAGRFREDRRYEVFLHQAAWTALLLGAFDRSEMVELSPAVDYPFHLHDEIPAGRRAISLDSLVGIRTEYLFDDPDWPERFPVLAPLADWIAAGD